MNEIELEPRADRLITKIKSLDSSSTLEAFMATCELKSWDGVSSGAESSAYTWWLEDGYGLHACFANGPDIITNRFGPCGISHAGQLVWKLSQTEHNWNTICGLAIMDLAAGPHPDVKN